MGEISFALVCSVLGAILGVLGFLRLSKKDIQHESENFANVATKIDYISKGVDDIRLDIRDHNRQFSDMNQRLTRVEESAKSAHKRIDSLEKEGV